MTDAMRTFRAYLNTHDKLVTEIRGFDPGTDRDADDCCIGGYTASLSMAACGVLSHSDDELMSELPDLRTIAESILARVEKLGG